MNALKDRQIDEWNKAHALGHSYADVPAIAISRSLTWDEVEALTQGRLGPTTSPCPFCGPDKPHSKRFRIRRPTERAADWYCFYCGEHGSLTKEGPVDLEEELKARQSARELQEDQRAAKIGRALAIWNEALPIQGTAVIEYLAKRSIQDLPPNSERVLRYHPRCPFGKQGFVGCMVALLRDVATDEPRAIHRTWITRGGEVYGRMALGPIGGAAIKLWPLQGDRLVIGEGIETVLSAATRPDVIKWREPLQPAWALTVANSIGGFRVIPSVQRLRILVDNDASGVGQAAAEACSRRWCDDGRDVKKLMPRIVGHDFNDVVRESERHGR